MRGATRHIKTENRDAGRYKARQDGKTAMRDATRHIKAGKPRCGTLQDSKKSEAMFGLRAEDLAHIPLLRENRMIGRRFGA